MMTHRSWAHGLATNNGRLPFAFHKILAWGWWRAIPLIWMSPVTYCFEHRATPSRKLTRGTGTRSLLLFGTFCFAYQTKHSIE
jgi:hypothetical protein